MSKTTSVGIDVGTYQVKVVVAEAVSENGKEMPRIVATGFAESRGMRHGYILNEQDVAKSVAAASGQAEKAAGMKIKRALLSVGGIGLGSVTSQASIMVSRADGEITELDVEKVIAASAATMPQSYLQNRRILHTIPLSFKTDGKPLLSRPVGVKGMKLEVKTLFVTCLTAHVNELIEAAAAAGISAEEIVAAPIAASLVALTRAQKVAGCVLVNIGSDTVSIIVFEDGLPLSLEVFPLGSNDITNDIALGLRIPLEEAEQVKRGSVVNTPYPRKKLEEIIAARLSDIFELIEAHLKKIGRSGLLPAGIVLTGGGAAIEAIEELAKTSLKLPSRIAAIQFGATAKSPLKDATWSVSYGLAILGLTGEENAFANTPRSSALKKTKGDLVRWLKQFLP